MAPVAAAVAVAAVAAGVAVALARAEGAHRRPVRRHGWSKPHGPSSTPRWTAGVTTT